MTPRDFDRTDRDPVVFPITDGGEVADRNDVDVSTGVYEAWENLHAANRARRAYLTPELFGPRTLPHIIIIDVVDNGRDYRWRLFGGHHVTEYGDNLTGKYLSEVMAERQGPGHVLRLFEGCRATAKPYFYRIQYVNARDVLRTCTGVLLPLFDETGDRVDHLLGCSEWKDG